MKAETSVPMQLRAPAVCRPKEYVTTTRRAYRSCGSYPAIPLTFFSHPAPVEVFD